MSTFLFLIQTCVFVVITGVTHLRIHLSIDMCGLLEAVSCRCITCDCVIIVIVAAKVVLLEQEADLARLASLTDEMCE